MSICHLVETLLQMTNMDDNNKLTSIQLSKMIEDIITELSILARNIKIKLYANDSVVLANIDMFY